MRLSIVGLFILFLIASCATPGTPQGGPQDKDAPIVKTYAPDILQTQFKEKEIIITFDEWVQVQNLKQNLIISPPISPEPNIYAKKNELHIQFKEALKENTTYSIFFGDAVKDNNEGNVANNLSYVFSTGDYLDSLKISGKLLTLDGSPIPENTFVELYRMSDDSVITKERPNYIYKISKDGTFEINYLPKDTFRLFALNDLNTNYLYDLPTEWVGKYPEPIILDSSVSGLTLPIILPESEQIRILQYNNTLEDNFLKIEFNKELHPSKDTVFLKNLTSGRITSFLNNYTSKNFQYFILSDSLSMNCELSINSNIIDTIRVRKPSKPSENLVFLPNDQLTRKDSILSAFDNEKFSLISNVPVDSVHLDKIFYVSGEDTLLPSSYSLLQNGFVLQLHLPLKENQKGRIFFEDSSVVFVNAQILDSTSFEMNYAASTLFGNLSFDIQLPSSDTSYVVRLFYKSGIKIHDTIVSGDTLYHFSLPPVQSGDFFVEVIEDINQSGTWNGASFWNYRVPEKVFKSESFSIKPNWEDTQVIKVHFNQAQKPTVPVSILDLMKNSSSTLNSGVEKPSMINSENKPSLDRGVGSTDFRSRERL